MKDFLVILLMCRLESCASILKVFQQKATAYGSGN